MKKSFSQIIDELTVTNIKIFHLAQKMEQKKPNPQDAKKLRDLNKYRLELSKALDNLEDMEKSFSQIIDELTITNIKIFNLVDKIQKNKHTRADAKKAHDLNRYRSELCNAINRKFNEKENIKV